MKVKDLYQGKEFFTVLFNHLRDNNIESAWYPCSDYDMVLEKLLECEVRDYSCWKENGIFNLDFKHKYKDDGLKTMIFNFGACDDERVGSHVIVNMNCREEVCGIHMSFEGVDGFLPFYRSLVNEEGRVMNYSGNEDSNETVELKEENIISIHGIYDFFENNNARIDLVFIGVK